MKTLLFAGAALAALTALPAVAQPAPSPQVTAVPAGPPPLRRADVEQQLRDQFTRLDANHDNVLTRQEADADTGARGPGPGGPGTGGPGRGMDAFFDRLDTNHDGVLSREEFAAMRSMYRGGGGGGGFMALNGNWFDRVDANKDGKVTLDEMRAVVLGLFDRVDANHDGMITPDEREAAMRASMRARQEQQPPADGQ